MIDYGVSEILSAAGEFRISEHTASIECISIFSNVCLLIVKLSLSQAINEFLLVSYYFLSVSSCVQMFPKVRVFILLSVPYTRTLLGCHLKHIWVQLLKYGIRELSRVQGILRFLSEFLSSNVRRNEILRGEIFILSYY